MDCLNGQMQLPPGFRFHPRDEELVIHYLCRRCAGFSIGVPIIADVDLYKFDPWQLPGMALYGEKEWYFFSPRDRKYPNGSRPNRAAGSGYWKATGADKPIGSPRPLAIKKALVFYSGKVPKGEKTNWIMHEYRLADADRSTRRKDSLRLDDWVLCRIHNKGGCAGRPSAPAAAVLPMSINSPLIDQKPIIRAPVMSSHLQLNPSGALTYIDQPAESAPRVHTDSSCSEHVLSPEFEVQSRPKLNNWERVFASSAAESVNPAGSMMSSFQSGSSSSGEINDPLLQDILTYWGKPF